MGQQQMQMPKAGNSTTTTQKAAASPVARAAGNATASTVAPAKQQPWSRLHANRTGGGPVFVYPANFQGNITQNMQPTAPPVYDAGKDPLFGGAAQRAAG